MIDYFSRAPVFFVMGKSFRIMVFGFITTVLSAAAAFGADAGGKVLVREGSAIDGMQGRLSPVKADDGGPYIRFDGDDVWLFELGSDVNDYRNVLKAGAKLQLLPSTALEKIIADFEEHPEGTYRLWGRITKYKGANYIFAYFFLPVVEMAPMKFDEPNEAAEPDKATDVAPGPAAEPNVVKTPAQPKNKPEPNEPASRKDEAAEPAATRKIETPKSLRDPNGVLEIPQDVLDKLNSKEVILPRKMTPRVKEAPRKLEPRKVVLPNKIKDGAKADEEAEKDSGAAMNVQEKVKKDSASANETKMETEERPNSFERPAMKLDSVLADRTAVLVKQNKALPVFVLDAFGLSAGTASLHVLPCEVLELTESRAGAALNPMRFKIAGIKTKYKGKDYLLLQKATRIYGHGNFGN